VLASRRWPTVAPVRYASFIVDSLLLAAAALVIALPTPVFRNAWLAIKLWLVGVYIVLANYAIRRGRTRASRALFLVAALPVYADIVTVAWTHDPLDRFRLLERCEYN
jgi:uncharacterized membrane protein SirB2